MKRYQEIWTEEVFIIDAIVYGNPTTYKIKDQDKFQTFKRAIESNFIWEKFWKNDCKQNLNFWFLFKTFHTVGILIRSIFLNHSKYTTLIK